MCGIVGYVGHRNTVEVLLDGLKQLEYRGYDSAGVAVYRGGELKLVKTDGRIGKLEARIREERLEGEYGLGHTRWATHGRPSLVNAHPHVDCKGNLVVVHNGIIENYRELKERLQKRGHRFTSETDTEVIVHLVEEFYDHDLDFAVKAALHEVRGAYAIGVMSRLEPGVLLAARQGSPLILGVGEGENFIASDIPAVLDKTRDVIFLEEGEVARVTRDGIDITTLRNRRVERRIHTVTWDAVAAQKGGYEHFMLKEIHEQPKAVLDTIRDRVGPDGPVHMEEIGLPDEAMRACRRVVMVACGTSLHAGLVGKFLFEKLARLPVECDYASEYRYRDPIVRPDDLVVVISQSGETADTLAAMRLARARGARTLGIVNVLGSTITREANATLYTHAGPEIGVASTKAFTAQLSALYVLALAFARARAALPGPEIARIAQELLLMPRRIETALKLEPAIVRCAERYRDCPDFLFLGRNVNYPIALEGALKLKEISYIHGEGYPAGEMKHGPIALVSADCPSVVLLPPGETYEKVVSNLQEVKARDGQVIAVAQEGDAGIDALADHTLLLPKTPELLTPLLYIVPLQLLAYHVARLRGCDVDKPRNLAKSVTVE